MVHERTLCLVLQCVYRNIEDWKDPDWSALFTARSDCYKCTDDACTKGATEGECKDCKPWVLHFLVFAILFSLHSKI